MKKMVFKTLKKDEIKFADYENFRIADLGDGEIYTGEPYLASIKEYEFLDENTGEMQKRFSAELVIGNHQEKEKITARLNLKSNREEHSFWPGSLGYDIIDSIEQLHGEQGDGNQSVYTISLIS